MHSPDTTMIVLRNKKIRMGQPQDVAQVFQDLLKLEDTIDQEKEHFYVMHLDARQQIKMVELVVIGTLTEMMIHPREIYKRAVIESSSSIIVAHNHPSGEVSPSDDDMSTTRRLHEAGEILGIPLLDHIVFTPDKYYSFKSNNLAS